MKSLSKIFFFVFVIIIFFANQYKAFSQDSLASLNTRSNVRSFVSVQGTYVRHLGEFSSTWSHTTGVYVSYGLQFPGNYILNFKSGYLTLHNRDGINFPENSGSTIVPLLVGGKYFFDLNRVQPYLSFNNGINLIFQKVDLNGQRDEKTLVKYYWQAGIGSFVRIYKNLKLDLSVNLNSHFYQDDAMMTGFEYMIGIQY